jgi:hypothetical protein
MNWSYYDKAAQHMKLLLPKLYCTRKIALTLQSYALQCSFHAHITFVPFDGPCYIEWQDGIKVFAIFGCCAASVGSWFVAFPEKLSVPFSTAKQSLPGTGGQVIIQHRR